MKNKKVFFIILMVCVCFIGTFVYSHVQSVYENRISQSNKKGYRKGYDEGHDQGYAQGYHEGNDDGYVSGLHGRVKISIWNSEEERNQIKLLLKEFEQEQQCKRKEKP